MKIIIQSKGDPKTGKGKFVSRLIPALQRHGVEVSGNIKDTGDIALHIGRVHYKSRCKKNVLRLGPAHVDTSQKYQQLNKEKWKSVKRADAIIYQSNYSKKICRKFIGKRDIPDAVIFNGADPAFYRESIMQDFLYGENPYKVNFVCSTRHWISQKRWKYINAAFRAAGIPNSCLWTCGGDIPPGHSYMGGICECRLGLVDDLSLGRLFNHCNAMVHITYLDACPNSVVESLVAGCPVICTDQGGTHELIRDNCGVVIPDTPYNFKSINLSKPPRPDMQALINAFKHYAQDRDDADPDVRHLHIDNTAKQYVDFFGKIL